jgi:hypothetical protein
MEKLSKKKEKLNKKFSDLTLTTTNQQINYQNNK